MDTGVPLTFQPVALSGRTLRRRLSSSTSLSRRLDIETLEPRILLSADLLPIHGAIDVPGQTNQYSFSLKDAKQIYFDAETNNGALNWSLDGPKGNEVSQRSFTGSDSAELGGTPLLSLAPGDYLLTINTNNGSTGEYDFRLLDAANAKPITPGQDVSGTLNPANSTDLYQFQATKGQSFFFDTKGVSGNDPYWRLIGPNNSVVFGPTYLGYDIGNTTLTQDGTYTLAIEGRYSNSGATNYSFNVQPVVTHTASLAIGATKSATLSTPGQSDRYTFDLAGTTQVVFDSLTNNGNMSWSLDGPHGREVDGRAFAYSDADRLGGNTVLTLGSGSYTLTVAGSGDTTGAYAFRLLDFSATTAIALGDTVSATLTDAGASDNIHVASTAPFDAGAGVTNRAFAVDARAMSATVPHDAALNPAGALTVEAWLLKDPSAGTWSSVISKSTNSGWGDGYGLAIYPDGKLHFFVGNYSTGNVAADLPANTWTHVAGTWDGTTLRLYLNGTLANEAAYSGPSNNTTAPLLIGNGGGGGYPWRGLIDELRIWTTARTAAEIAADAATANPAATTGLAAAWHFDEASGRTLADATGNGHDATINNQPGTETRLYSFAATAGTRVFFDELSVSGSVYRRLYGPSGELLYGPEGMNDRGVMALPATGTYTLSVEGSPYAGSGTGYAFRIVEVQDTTAALTIGDAASGSIDTPGQVNNWTFHLGSRSRLLFDSLSNVGFNWTLTGPRGTEVSGRDLRNSDSWDGGAGNLLDLIEGDYVLTVAAPGDATGSYSFRMINMAAAPAIAVGDKITGTLNPGNTTLQYKFNAQAGDQISLAQTSGDAYWRLVDPTGRVLVGPAYLGGTQPAATTLPSTGLYTLLIEGRYYLSSTIDFSFLVDLQGHVDLPAPAGTAINPGDTVSGNIATVNTGVD
ncbi:MAG: LEPR-XLL domain-containing protein, partial [Proteobacteria bacterium]|nr:LEPR-XLL domain-containing protein [Pseudomonadota bacterium]